MALGAPNVQARLSPAQVSTALGQGNGAETLGLPAGVQLDDVLSYLRVFKHSDERDGHWELFITTVANVTIKIDLTEHQYRMLFNAAPRPTDKSTTSVPLVAQFRQVGTTVRQAIAAIVTVATEMGPRTGTDDYNCQDFTVRFMAALGVGFTDSLKFALRREILKNHENIATSGALPDGF